MNWEDVFWQGFPFFPPLSKRVFYFPGLLHREIPITAVSAGSLLSFKTLCVGFVFFGDSVSVADLSGT